MAEHLEGSDKTRFVALDVATTASKPANKQC